MFTFRVHNILTRQFVMELPLYDVEWSDPLNASGELNAKIALNDIAESQRPILRNALNFDNSWLIVVGPENTIVWNGLIVAAPWDNLHEILSIKVAQMSVWFYKILVGDNGANVYTNKDQLFIARDLVSRAWQKPRTRSVPCLGTPEIKVLNDTSGVNRDYTVEAFSYKKVGECLDEIANLSNGFSWRLDARFSSYDNLPELVFLTFYPERIATRRAIMALTQTPESYNINGYGDFPADASERYTQVYAVGEPKEDTTPAVYMYAMNVDPRANKGIVLLTETSTSYSGKGITQVATLADHAYNERVQRSKTVSTLTVEIPIEDSERGILAPHEYYTGDRVSLRVKDNWVDEYFPAVRIMDRTVRVNQSGESDVVSLELDLADRESIDGETL